VVVQNEIIFVKKPFFFNKKIKVKKGFYSKNPRIIKNPRPIIVRTLLTLKGISLGDI